MLQYADDIMVLIKGMTVDSVRAKASEAYEVLHYWFLRNRLKLNSQKTHFMYIMTSKRAAGKALDEPVKFGSDYVVPSKSEPGMCRKFGPNWGYPQFGSFLAKNWVGVGLGVANFQKLWSRLGLGLQN